MHSIGLRLEQWVKKGLLQFHTTRPTVHGLEMHLVLMHKLVSEYKPTVVIVDPISNLQTAGTLEDSSSMLTRLVDFLRKEKITGFMVSLGTMGSQQESTDEGLSSMVDTWMLLRDIELGGERNRALYVLKSRGMNHSNQVREFLITSKGIKLVVPYLGAEGVLTGSARLTQEAKEKAIKVAFKDELRRKEMAMEHRRKAMQAQIEALQAGFKAEEEEFFRMQNASLLASETVETDRDAMARSRK